MFGNHPSAPIVLNMMQFAVRTAASALLLVIPRAGRGAAQAAKLSESCEKLRDEVDLDQRRCEAVWLLCFSTDTSSCLREEKMPWLKQQPSFR